MPLSNIDQTNNKLMNGSPSYDVDCSVVSLKSLSSAFRLFELSGRPEQEIKDEITILKSPFDGFESDSEKPLLIKRTSNLQDFSYEKEELDQESPSEDNLEEITLLQILKNLFKGNSIITPTSHIYRLKELFSDRIKFKGDNIKIAPAYRKRDEGNKLFLNRLFKWLKEKFRRENPLAKALGTKNFNYSFYCSLFGDEAKKLDRPISDFYMPGTKMRRESGRSQSCINRRYLDLILSTNTIRPKIRQFIRGPFIEDYIKERTDRFIRVLSNKEKRLGKVPWLDLELKWVVDHIEKKLSSYED